MPVFNSTLLAIVDDIFPSIYPSDNSSPSSSYKLYFKVRFENSFWLISTEISNKLSKLPVFFTLKLFLYTFFSVSRLGYSVG